MIIHPCYLFIYYPLMIAILIEKETMKEKYDKLCKILLDSRANSSMIKEKFVQKRTLHSVKSTEWITAAGAFKTSSKAQVMFQLPEYSTRANINLDLHICKND